MDFRWDLIIDSLPYLLAGAWMTVTLTGLSMAIGLVVGTAVGIGRMAKNPIVHRLASAYVDFFRGTPLLIQLLLIYYGMAQMGLPLGRFQAGVLGLSLNSAAYIAEIVRAGIQSIEKGQVEAAIALGLTRAQAFRHVILPQAFRRMIPALGNEFIMLTKDSSLVMVIALEELMRRGQLIVTRTFRAVEIYLTVALIYLILTKLISLLVNYTEQRMRVDMEPRRGKVPPDPRRKELPGG